MSFAREGATTIPEIETGLTALGRNVGFSLLELVTLRDKGSKREVWSNVDCCCRSDFDEPFVHAVLRNRLSF